jgi:short-chain fatty acids transporter
MSFSSSIEKTFKTLLPAPFTIAVVLTIITMALAFTLTSSESTGIDRVTEVLGFWEEGLWNTSLLVFAMQMMLMLVLGHTLALTKPVDSIISYATRFCSTTANAAAIVTFLTVLVALFNWGLGLIFGAILARKVGEHAAKNDIDLNYPLIGAAGYSGLMVWHGGISGSAPIKVAEEGHITSLMRSIISPEQLQLLPDPISFSETVFSSMNLTATLLVVIVHVYDGETTRNWCLSPSY